MRIERHKSRVYPNYWVLWDRDTGERRVAMIDPRLNEEESWDKAIRPAYLEIAREVWKEHLEAYPLES